MAYEESTWSSVSHRVTKRLLDELLEMYADATGQRVGHYELVAADAPMLPETQVAGVGGEADTAYQGLASEAGMEYRTIPGGLVLDHNPTYGGYVIERIAPNGRTWISTPYGERRSPREMEAFLRGMLAGVSDD